MVGRSPRGLPGVSRLGRRVARAMGRRTALEEGLRINGIISRGERLVRNGKFSRALKVYDRLVEMYPDSPLPRLGRATALFMMGRREEASAECDRAMDMEPGYLDIFGCGGAQASPGRSREAKAAHGGCVSLDPNYVFYHSSCGNSLYKMDRHEEALAAYYRAVELDPNYAYYHSRCGDVLSKMGRHEEAMGAYERAAELEPDDSYYHACCGEELRELGRHEEALAAYGRAIRLEPRKVWARDGYVDSLKALGRGGGPARGGAR